MAREAPRITLSTTQHEELLTLVNARNTPQGLVLRARIVLRCAQDDRPTNQQVAAELGCDPDTVSRWRWRVRKLGLTGLQDLPRSGRPATFSP